MVVLCKVEDDWVDGEEYEGVVLLDKVVFLVFGEFVEIVLVVVLKMFGSGLRKKCFCCLVEVF